MELTQTLTRSAEATAPGQTLSLDTLLPMAWDHVLIVGPYTPVALIEKAMGASMSSQLRAIEIDQRDDVHAVVFVQQGQVAAAVALPRRVADFDKADLLRPVPRGEARLIRASSGVRFSWLTL